MKDKTTRELLTLIRDSQSKLAMNLFGSLSDEEIDKLYDTIIEAEMIIIQRTDNK